LNFFQQKEKEATFVFQVQTRGMETGYNFCGIAPEPVSKRAGMLSFPCFSAWSTPYGLVSPSSTFSKGGTSGWKPASKRKGSKSWAVVVSGLLFVGRNSSPQRIKYYTWEVNGTQTVDLTRGEGRGNRAGYEEVRQPRRGLRDDGHKEDTFSL